MEANPKSLGDLPKAYQSSTPDMTVAIQARAHIGAVLQFVAPQLPLKSALPRAAAFIGINARRARALWNREARAVLAEEIHALEAARARIAERIITREMHQHANTMELYAARLASVDPEGNRAEIDRLRRMAQRARHFASDEEAA
ncbi:hypothetical protein [Bosea minatitlanensis]|uniref:Uncharacterized protein n=1 Tax=Bosea minatitlanensis TaxID=128782 RepID=A0ABW0F3K6_9HYPH|nr:hypothetical protein [Bosea minatitlanensis]MCT4493002.1 hypothetical protein [Bosea minatitlanensis]